MGEVPICLIIALSHACTGTSVSSKYQGIHLSPTHSKLAWFVHYLGEGAHLFTLLHLFWSFNPCTDGEFHIPRNTGSTSPLLPSQALPWLSSWPCMEPLPSFEPVVTAAAVLPDARPTGLECFPALPGILSPLGFSMIPVSCSSGSYCQCLKSCPRVTLQASWWCTSSSIVTHLGEKSTKKSEWDSMDQAPRKQCPSLEESEPFIFYPIKQRWYFPHSLISHPHVTFFFHQSQSPGPKLKLPGTIK